MFTYFNSCVGWDPCDVHSEGGLSDLIDKKVSISRRAFLSHVDRAELAEIEESLSYARHPSQGLTMAGDWHVDYFRSKLHGETVYGFDHSRIEYVFTRSEP